MSKPTTLAAINVAATIRNLTSSRPRTYPTLPPDEPCGPCGGLIAVHADGSRHHLGACTP